MFYMNKQYHTGPNPAAGGSGPRARRRQCTTRLANMAKKEKVRNASFFSHRVISRASPGLVR
jgi:hypothetical protein